MEFRVNLRTHLFTQRQLIEGPLVKSEFIFLGYCMSNIGCFPLFERFVGEIKDLLRKVQG